MPFARRLILTATAALATAIAPPSRAEFDAEQRAALMRGESVVEDGDFVRGYQQFVGGISYLVVDRTAQRLSETARDPRKLALVLPFIESVTLLSVTPGGRARLRIEHVIGPFHGGYTVLLEFTDGGRYGRFWVDPSADNDLHDAWGFVRLTPLGDGSRTLVTTGVLFDLGPSVFRSLFQTRIKNTVLSLPRRLADAA